MLEEQKEDNRIKTPEQLHKIQKELDDDNKAFIASLPENERRKFTAVEKALKLLGDAGVPVTMFTELPSRQYHSIKSDKDSVFDMLRYTLYQYNNISLFVDNSGQKWSNRDAILLSKHNLSLALSMCHYFKNTVASPDTPYNMIPILIGQLANIRSTFLFDKTIPEEWKQFVNEDGTYKNNE